MGQVQSIAEHVIPDTVGTVQMEVVRHAKVLTEINSLSYEEFKTCLKELNSLSRKCIDSNGKQLIFLVKKGTDSTVLWKATVKIACIKVDPNTRVIDGCKLLNLKQFLCVFKTFQEHLENLATSETQRTSRHGSQSSLATNSPSNSCLPAFTASLFIEQVNALLGSSLSSSSSPTTSTCSHNEHFEECSICLDRGTEVILPCAHSFCVPCIEQWNVHHKTCPICCDKLENTDESWVLSDIPGVEEINDAICSEFMELGKDAKKQSTQ